VDKEALRTPYRRVNHLGSAGEGTGDFIAQRVTAFANIFLIAFAIWLGMAAVGATRAEVVALFSNPIILTLAVLTAISVSWHMKIGVAEVINDYVHSERGKALLLMANFFFAFAVATLCTVCVLMLGFGG
jgi:succinate dehydrogenase / fumarate reductase membrane anchor subunit